MKITEKEFKEYCKDCYTPEFHIVLTKVANTPIYIRRYFELLGRKTALNKIKPLISRVEYKEAKETIKEAKRLFSIETIKEAKRVFSI